MIRVYFLHKQTASIVNGLEEDVTNAAAKAVNGAIDNSKLAPNLKDAAHGVMNNVS